MQDASPQAILLADYQAPSYTTESVDLTFELHDTATQVTSVLSVRRQDPQATTLCLDGEHLELVSVELDGRTLSDNEYQVGASSLTLAGLEEEHQIRIVTRIHPDQNTALEGLYRSSQMYCTQCEAQGFRRITYYQDRPDVLARFSTTIIADGAQFPTLLSNGNMEAATTLADGRRQVTWRDPFPKPAYLFALVAGDLAVLEDTYITGSGRSIDLKIYSEPHNIGQCDYAMDVLKRSMAWDEEAFGREYDLDIYMIVAVEDFNMGAMENKGLNVFNTSCVLASPDTATDAAYLRVEAVVAHEYFHNWSGNRVTCRDWFQLSLKEGFTVFRDAEFSGDMNSRAVKRIEDVGFLRSVQFAEDAGPLAHSVRPDSYIEISNFYTTTIYEKGAEVVRMYHTLLGPELFRAGSDLYFDRFDGQAVTTDDFCAVMQEVSGIDLQQFKRWYEQAGTPELTVTETFVDGSLRLQIDQRCPDTPGQSNKPPLHIPLRLGLLDENGAELKCDGGVVTSDAEIAVRTDGLLVQLKAARTVIEVAGLVAKPVVSFLRCFSAPVRVAYARPAQELAFLAVQDTDGFVRWDALQTLWIEHFDGHGSVDLVALVGELAAQAATLNSAEAMQLAAQMLVVPEANYVFEQLAEFDVDGVLDARDAALSAIASAHRAHWQQLYDKTVSTSAFQPDGLSMARRALNNIALAYLVRAEPADAAATLIRAHFDGADNLTARRGALQAALSRADEFGQLTEDLLSGFYARWKDEALVIDLWFNLQAQADSTSVERACALAEHEAFNAQNPNRARSLYAAFAMFNHRRFHALDGSGYDFLGAAIAELDNINPQLAARLATPLTRWQRYDARRQGLMRGVLQALAGKADISKDLYEIATKSLAV